MRKTGYIQDKYGLINDVIDDSSFLNELLRKDIILSKLNTKEKQYIEKQITTAFMAQGVIEELIRVAKKKDKIRTQYKLKPLFDKEDETALTNLGKKVKEMFLMKAEIIKATNRNRDDNFIMRALFGIKDKEETIENEEEEVSLADEKPKKEDKKKKKKKDEESED